VIAMTIRVCVGTSCHLKGSYNVIAIFQQLIEKYKLYDKVKVKAAFCMGKCGGEGVCVSIDGLQSHGITSSTAKAFFEDNVLPEFHKKKANS
jgi:NADH:ubiquinone oxidoreductase subunit E